MEEFMGKLCPGCNGEIREGEEVIFCPDCGLPHHKSCWEEKNGCSNPDCNKQKVVAEPDPVEQAESSEPGQLPILTLTPPVISEPSGAFCVNCGSPLDEGVDFCPRCGMKQPKKAVCCPRCGTEIQEGHDFCPVCGNKLSLAIDANVHSAINTFNTSLEKKKKKKWIIPVAIGVFVMIASIAGILIGKAVHARRIEEARQQYLRTAEEFASYSLTAGSNLEDIADTIQEYWYDCIWFDMYGDDIDTAIYYALLDKSTEISLAKTHKTKMDNLYSQLRYLPDGVSDRHTQQVHDAVVKLYNVYLDFYNFATDPSGSYNTFSEGNKTKTDNYIEAYRALDNLLD